MKVQGNQYVNERYVTGEDLRAVPLVYLGEWLVLYRRSGVPAGAGVQAPGKKPPGAWLGIHASPAHLLRPRAPLQSD